MKKKQATTQKHYSPRAVLVAIGTKIRALKLLQPIEELVRIRQKTVKYSPAQKLMDGLITILAGAHGFCEINTRLRNDPACPPKGPLQGWIISQPRIDPAL